MSMRIELRLASRSLKFTTQVDVLLPQCGRDGDADSFYSKDHELPMLLLLHGGSGGSSDWPRFTRVELLCDEFGVGIVCPSAESSSYLNNYYGSRYSDWVYEELYEQMHVMFPFSRDRDKNFCAGLSMGGYGAYRAAFRFPEKFGWCAGLSSGAYLPQQVVSGEHRTPGALATFGPFDQILGGDADLFQAAIDLKESGKEPPKLFWTCGSEDFGIEGNRLFRDHLLSLGYDLTWFEAPGIHNWDFWEAHIRDVMEWLPLK